MRVLDIAARDIYVVFEMSLTQINYLLDYLDHAEVQLNLSDEYSAKVDKYVREELFIKLNELAQGAEKDGIGFNRPGD